ncbi:MAG: hypothetical protein H7833_17360 [Magnetococcus sp. DMHC-1]
MGHTVKFKGSAKGAVVSIGNHVTIQAGTPAAAASDPAREEMLVAMRALREILATMHSPHANKIECALADAEEEVARPQPDRDKIGSALQRALGYAQKTGELVQVMDKLKPHIQSVAGWLKTAGRPLTEFLGGAGG